MTRTETKWERKRKTTTKQNTSNSSYLVEEVTRQILSLYTKSLVIFKNWFNRFFLCSGMKLEFLLSTGIIINNFLYSFGHKEKVDLFVCFALKCEPTTTFLICFPTGFRCASTVTRTFCPYETCHNIASDASHNVKKNCANGKKNYTFLIYFNISVCAKRLRVWHFWGSLLCRCYLVMLYYWGLIVFCILKD